MNLEAENFNTNKAADYVGINVGWNIGTTNLNNVASMK